MSTALLRIQWDPNVAGDNVEHYNLYVDALPPVVVPPSALVGGVMESPQPFADGPHTVKVAAVNRAVSSDPGSLQEGPPITVTFTVNARVSVTNIRILK